MDNNTLLLLEKYISQNYKPYKKVNNGNSFSMPIIFTNPIVKSLKNKNDIIYEGFLNKWSVLKLKEELLVNNYNLSLLVLKDSIIKFFFENKIYNFKYLNEALEKYNIEKYIRVGYQGLLYSNSYFASKMVFKGDNIIFVPLLDSKTVVEKLLDNEIEYGVMAKANSITGIVKETEKALASISYNYIDKVDLPIHHSIFKRNDIDIKDLKYVASHIQALLQTRNTRKRLGINLEEVELKDTAIGAIDLASNKLPKNYAIICNKDCGINNGLDLIYQDVEDDINNKTSFIVISL